MLSRRVARPGHLHGVGWRDVRCGPGGVEGRGGEGKLVLFFDTTGREARQRFTAEVEQHLQRRAIPDSIRRRRAFTCGACGKAIPDDLATTLRGNGIESIRYSGCRTDVSLLDPGIEPAGSERYATAAVQREPNRPSLRKLLRVDSEVEA